MLNIRNTRINRIVYIKFNFPKSFSVYLNIYRRICIRKDLYKTFAATVCNYAGHCVNYLVVSSIRHTKGKRNRNFTGGQLERMLLEIIFSTFLES